MSTKTFPILDKTYDSIELCNIIAKNNNLIVIHIIIRCYYGGRHDNDIITFHKYNTSFLPHLSTIIKKYTFEKNLEISYEKDNALKIFCSENWTTITILNISNELTPDIIGQYVFENFEGTRDE